MEPWQRWAAVGLVGAGAAYYYSQSGKNKRGRGILQSAQIEQAQRRDSVSKHDSKESRKKKGKAKTSDASDQAASDTAEASSASTQSGAVGKARKRKGEKKPPSKLAQSSTIDIGHEPDVDPPGDDDGDDMSNAEFARQLSGLKTGTSLKKAENTGENKRSRKQGKTQELPPNTPNGNALMPNGVTNGPGMSTASSTTGADADDDLSLPVSPEFGATNATTPSGVDVSDMLGAPIKGPSILRLTEPANPKPAKQPKEKKTAPEPETKKQRQNRQKKDREKALRDQAETERRAALEKQLRTAREAEGRPAKNGLGASTGTSKNVWDQPAVANDVANTGVQSLPRTQNGSLLDTFDEDTPILHAVDANTNRESNSNHENPKTQDASLPSEEEQLRLINEMNSDSHWSTVSKSGKGKKKRTDGVIPREGEKPIGTNETSSSVNTDYSSSNENSYAESKAHSNGNKVYNPDSSQVQVQTPPGNTSTGRPVETPTIRTNGSDTDGVGSLIDEHTDDAQKDTDQSNNIPKDTQRMPTNRQKATYKTIDHDVWTRENIHEHPDYDPAWPYALTGHPMDSDWAADWDFNDMKRSNEKRRKQDIKT